MEVFPHQYISAGDPIEIPEVFEIKENLHVKFLNTTNDLRVVQGIASFFRYYLKNSFVSCLPTVFFFFFFLTFLFSFFFCAGKKKKKRAKDASLSSCCSWQVV